MSTDTKSNEAKQQESSSPFISRRIVNRVLSREQAEGVGARVRRYVHSLTLSIHPSTHPPSLTLSHSLPLSLSLHSI